MTFVVMILGESVGFKKYGQYAQVDDSDSYNLEKSREKIN